jgi:hypothetical protein
MNKTFEYQLLRPQYNDLVVYNEGTVNERRDYNLSPEHLYPPLSIDYNNKANLITLLQYKKYDGVPILIVGEQRYYD